MKKYFFILFILLFSFTFRTLSSQCLARLDLNGLQAGSFELTDLNNKDAKQNSDVLLFKEYSVALKKPLINSKIFIALSSFQFINSSVDLFDINILSKTQNSFTLGFIYQSNKWSKISYRYWASNRNDLFFDMITLNSESFKKSKENLIQVNAQLQKQFVNFQNLQVLSFIRGLKYKNYNLISHSLSIQIKNQVLNRNSITFSIFSSLNTEKVSLQLLSLSYLIFQPQKVQFASFGGLISKSNYVGKSQIDILHIDLPSIYYNIYGLTTFDINDTKINFQTLINEQQYLIIDSLSSIQKFQITYFTIAIKAADVCKDCSLGKYVSGNICVNECSFNEIMFQFKDNSLACQKCGQNQLADSQQKNCLKKIMEVKEYKQKQVKIEIGQQSYTPLAQEVQGAPHINKSPSSQIIEKNKIIETGNSNSESYIPQSIPNSQINYSAKPNSIQKPINQIVKSNENFKPQAKTDVQTSNTRMPILIDSNLSLKQFVYCGTLPNSYWTGSSCNCKVGFTYERFQCIPITRIDDDVIQINFNRESSAYNENIKYGKKNTPSYKQSQKTQSASQIPVESNDSQTGNSTDQITDKKNYSEATKQNQMVDHNNSNKKHKDNKIQIQMEQGQCIIQHQVLNSQQQKCECIEGFGYLQKLNSSQKSCKVCELFEGYYLEMGQCKFCGKNQVYDEFKKICKCKSNFRFDQSKNCIQKNKSIQSKEKPSTINTQIQNNSSTSIQQRNKNTSINNPTNIQPLQNPSSSSLNNDSSNKTIVQKDNLDTTSNKKLSQSNNQQNSSQLEQKKDIRNFDCMKMSTSPKINTANVYVSLQLKVQKKFKSQDQMKNFLKYQFSDSINQPSSVYCNQNQVQLKQFDCLLLYPNGVPNQNFEVDFWYNDSLLESQCRMKINVNPLQAVSKSQRALRGR